MVKAVSRRLVRPSRAALVLLVAGGAVAGCGDNRPFSRNNTASDATKLAVPSTLTPPVQVGRIDGAPAAWHMNEKVAEALRQRDIPSGTAKQGQTGYVLRGEVRQTNQTAESSQVNVVWKLYDNKGNKVGEVTQVAAIPRGAMRKTNDDLLEAIADAAAESISPIVPSTRIDVADNVTTGEPDDKKAARAAKDKVTALGRQKPTNSGIARNFKAHVNGDKTPKATALTLPRPLAKRDDDAKRATAIGRLDDGNSVLSRNLAKGINPAAGDDTKTKRRKVDARPPELSDPKRAEPKIAFRERPRPVKLHKVDGTQVATAPKTKAEPTKRPPHVVTEFYPNASKARRQATAPTPVKRVTIASTPAPKASPPARKKVAAIAPSTRSTTVDIPPPPKKMVKKVAKRTVKKAVEPAPKQVAATPPARTAGKFVFWVQVGSYRTATLSAAKWTETRDRAPALLGNVAHRIHRARVGDRGIWHRIQVGPYATKSLALEKCRQLKAAQVDCFILPERSGPGLNPISQAPLRTPRVTVVTNDTDSIAAVPRRVHRSVAKAAPRRHTRRYRRTGRHADDFPLTTAPGLPGVIP